MGVIRLMLALSVVLAHAGPVHGRSLVGGATAVETFFIISGFYMALVLNQKYISVQQTVWQTWRTFIGARLLRLFPLYAIVLILTLVSQYIFLHLLGPSKLDSEGIPIWVHHAGFVSLESKIFLLLTNLLIIGQDAVMFLGINNQTGGLYFTSNFSLASLPAWRFLLIPQAWSLGIEIVFYILAPFIVRQSILILGTLLVLSVCIRILLLHNGLNFDPWTYRFFPAEICLFLAGALGYKLYCVLRKNMVLSTKLGVAAMLVGISCILGFQFTPLNHHLTIYFLIMALSLPAVFLLTANNRMDRWIGELSYPLYLCHVLVIKTLHLEGHKDPLAMCIASLAIATLLLIGIDIPVERLRQHWIKKRRYSIRPEPLPNNASSLSTELV